MKKILIISAMSLVAAGAFAQGTVVFNNRIGATTFQTHVFSPETGNPGLAITGNMSSDFPTGSTVYTGVGIGGSSTGTSFSNGSRYTAQLWALAGTGQPASSLQAITQYTSTFRTTGGAAAAGFLPNPPTLSSDPGIPNTTAGTATAQLRVWDNAGGTVNDWNTAVSVSATRGSSLPFTITGLYDGGTGTPPPPPNLTNLQSFNLTSVPEPSTIALGVMGAAAFLLRRRNK